MVVVAFFLIPVFWQINNYFGYAGKAKYSQENPFGTVANPTNTFMVSCNEQYPMTPTAVPASTAYENTNPDFVTCTYNAQ
jgi:hypothetical protein